MMKRIIIVFLFILSGCTPEKKNPESQKEPQAENVNIECIYEIQTPYIDIWSPKVIEPMIYMGASDRSKNSDIIDTRLLVEYNIETKKTEILYESEYDSANIQGIEVNDNWLVWQDMEISGTQDNIYVMNRKTRETKKVNSIKTSAPSFTIPALIDDSVYWIEEEELIDNTIKGSIKRYDCINGKVDVISQLNSIGVHNIHLERNANKLLWSDEKDNKSYYYIYDTTNGKKDIIQASSNAVMHPIVVGDYIISMEAKNHSEIHDLYIYNIKTKESRKNNQYINGYYRFNNMIVCNDGLITSLFSIDEDLSITPRKVFSNQADNYEVTNGEYIIFYKENEKGIIIYIYASKDN